MPSRRNIYNLEMFRALAKHDNIRDFATRAGFQTDFVNSQIIKAINPGPEDVVVDIGCGDGSLLHSITKSISEGIGISLTTEEVDRLREEYKGVENLEFVPGLAQELWLKDDSATKVICNNLLHGLPSRQDVVQALKEIVRISRHGSLIWIGEVPEQEELPTPPKTIRVLAAIPYSYSPLRLLSYLPSFLKRWQHPFRGAVSRVNRQVLSSQNLEIIVMPPDDFGDLSKSCGLEMISYSRHMEIDATMTVVESKTRNDFLLRKP